MLEDSLAALAFGADADEQRLRAIETSQTLAHSELRSRMQDTQIDRVGRTVIGVLGICISGGEVLGSS